MKRIYSIAVLILFHKTAAFSQNARFSQIWSAPLQYNAALTGRFDGKIRISNLNSWESSNAKSIGAASMLHQNIALEIKLGKYRSSGDEKVAVGEIKKVHSKDALELRNKNHGYWGVGINYYHYGDNTAAIDGKFFSTSLARHFYNKSNKYYGLGGQIAFAQGNLNENRGSLFNYDKEISGGGFRIPTLNNRNINSLKLTAQKSYVDFNIGGYYGMITDAVLFELGFAMNHLFYPTNSFTNDSESKLRHRISANSILRVKLNDKLGLVQKNMYWQEGLYLRSKSLNGDSTEIIAFWSGVELYKMEPIKKINVNYGLYMRSFRTAMPYLNINMDKFVNLRYSYEFPLNSKKYNAYSAKRSELALILSLERNTKPGTKFYKKINFW